jgi:hypothetical protein
LIGVALRRGRGFLRSVAIVERAVRAVSDVFAIFVGVGKEKGVGENHTEKQSTDGKPEFHIAAHAGLLSHQASPLTLTGSTGAQTPDSRPELRVDSDYDIPAAFFKAPAGSSCLAVCFLSSLPSPPGGGLGVLRTSLPPISRIGAAMAMDE